MLLLFAIPQAKATTLTLPPGTSWTVPANVTSVTVQVWGGGGAGGGNTTNSDGGGGGGGGGYLTSTIAVSGSVAYSIGAGGTGSTGTGGNGGATTFGSVSATGGAGGQSASAGRGGGSGGSGTFSGGSGGAGRNNNNGTGGGGGSSAGTAANGGNGVNGGNSPGAGGTAPVGGGDGGDGGASGNFGLSGSVPGGGGGGSGDKSRTGGNGAVGQIIITYKTNQTITFGAQGAQTYSSGGTFAISPLATTTSGLTIAYTSTTLGVCTIAGTAVTISTAGTCTIAANQPGDTNYNAATQVTQNITINKASQTITFTSTAPVSAMVGGATYTPTVSATSGLAVTVVVDASASSVCSISGGVVSFTGAGTCVLDANQAGDGNYNAAPQVQQSFAVQQLTALAEYRFDESSAGSVTDSSGNSLSGTLNGGVTVGGTGKICTGYNFNGSNAFVSVPNTALLNPTQTTVAAWVRHNTATIKNWEAILAKGDSAYRLHLLGASGCSINGNNTLGAFSFAVNGGCAGADVSSGIVPVAGTWYHVVGTYDGATIKIYVNGTLQASGAYVSTIASNAYPLYIGENAQQTGRYWSGDIDEVKIYGVALSAGQIAAGYANESAGKNWDGTARVCLISAPHHLEIRHASGTGLTCAASTLSINACSDAACATPYTGGVSGTLSATGTPTVNWDGSTGGAVGAGFVIPSGSSSVIKNVQVATVGSVVFGITSPAPAPSNVTTCNFGSPACTFTANTAGFIYSNSTTGSSYTIPPQFSGSAATGLYLRAMQASTTNPAVCTPAIISSTTSVNMGYACNNPATCQAGNLATITNTTTSTATAIAPGGTSVSLNFDANGSAPITARYDDVGQITLNANATVTPLFTGATSVALNGSSNPYVVAPDHFGFSNNTAGLIKAGNNFSATVTAYNGLATAAPTANFGKETTPEGVTVSFNKCQPTGAGSSNGTFSGSVGSFNNGAASANNLNWSEVGNGDLVATLTSGSYLSSLLTATGNTGTGGTVCSAGAGNVGRFIPHHFDTVITQPGTTFTYSGQPFTTKATAMNFAGMPTTNYNATAGFSKDVTLSAWDSTGVTANPGPGALTPTQPAAIVLASAFTLTSPGAATVTTPTYTFTAAKTAPVTIRIRATDTDAVSSSDGVTEGTAVIRSGRLRVSNAFGSEKSNLSMAVSAEYWTGLSWLLNSDDKVSLIPTTAVALTPSGVVGSTVQGNVTLSGGQASIVLLKPTSGTGMVDLAINLGIGTADLSCLTTHPATTGAVLPWLRSLNGSCAATYDRDPSARATFGIYSPETRKTIHVRELY